MSSALEELRSSLVEIATRLQTAPIHQRIGSQSQSIFLEVAEEFRQRSGIPLNIEIVNSTYVAGSDLILITIAAKLGQTYLKVRTFIFSVNPTKGCGELKAGLGSEPLYTTTSPDHRDIAYKIVEAIIPPELASCKP